jgi:ubiquitin carboxyl-terminal hydrolase 36/42
MHKIMSKFVYNKNIDLTRFVNNGSDYKYALYGVLVHRGKTVTSGHYYSFINTSSDLSRSEWYKFNDNLVTEAE